MSNTNSNNSQKNTNTNATKSNDQVELEAVKEAAGDVVDEATAEVGSALKAAKAQASDFNWAGVAGTAAVAMIGSAANMIVSNQLSKIANPEQTEPRFKPLEMAAVVGLTGLVAGGTQATIQKLSDKVNDDQVVNLVVGSGVANLTIIGAAFGSGKLVDLARARLTSVDGMMNEIEA